MLSFAYKVVCNYLYVICPHIIYMLVYSITFTQYLMIADFLQPRVRRGEFHIYYSLFTEEQCYNYHIVTALMHCIGLLLQNCIKWGLERQLCVRICKTSHNNLSRSAVIVNMLHTRLLLQQQLFGLSFKTFRKSWPQNNLHKFHCIQFCCGMYRDATTQQVCDDFDSFLL